MNTTAMKSYLTQNNALLVMGILVLVCLGIFGYYKYTQKPKYIDNKEYESDNSSKNGAIDVYYFYVDWCPHCKKSRPVWEQLKSDMPIISGRPVRYHEVDCDNNPQQANKFEVTSYPTIKMVNDKQVTEYDAKPEVVTLKQFIRTAV
jgi:thiol-disulfide isomerase/thioredoxin